MYPQFPGRGESCIRPALVLQGRSQGSPLLKGHRQLQTTLGVEATHHLSWVHSLVLPMGKEHFPTYQRVGDALGPFDNAGFSSWQIIDPLEWTRLDRVEIKEDQVGIHALSNAPLLFEPQKTCRLRCQPPHCFLKRHGPTFVHPLL